MPLTANMHYEGSLIRNRRQYASVGFTGRRARWTGVHAQRQGAARGGTAAGPARGHLQWAIRHDTDPCQMAGACAAKLSSGHDRVWLCWVDEQIGREDVHPGVEGGGDYLATMTAIRPARAWLVNFVEGSAHAQPCHSMHALHASLRVSCGSVATGADLSRCRCAPVVTVST